MTTSKETKQHETVETGRIEGRRGGGEKTENRKDGEQRKMGGGGGDMGHFYIYIGYFCIDI